MRIPSYVVTSRRDNLIKFTTVGFIGPRFRIGCKTARIVEGAWRDTAEEVQHFEETRLSECGIEDM